ncbi:MAG: pentapeptide repeat-containing protein [Acidimicrobiales bacterium]
MPWVEVEEPYSAPPRLGVVAPSAPWSGGLERDGGRCEVVDRAIEAAEFGLLAGDEVWLVDSTASGVVFEPTDDATLDVVASSFDRCDLSRVRLRSIETTRFRDCKLVGVDLGGATVDDVVFEGCTFGYANLRAARLRRVQFIDCRLDDTDGYEIDLEDVDFAGSTLRGLNVDRMRARRVDLRGAHELGLEGAGRLDGCLVSEHQIPQLMYALAFSSGLGVEQETE